MNPCRLEEWRDAISNYSLNRRHQRRCRRHLKRRCRRRRHLKRRCRRRRHLKRRPVLMKELQMQRKVNLRLPRN